MLLFGIVPTGVLLTAVVLLTAFRMADHLRAQSELTLQVLADGQNWFVTVNDGSGACQYDFMAVTASQRQIERRDVNVCGVYEIYFN